MAPITSHTPLALPTATNTDPVLSWDSCADNSSEITSIASSTSGDTDVQVYFQDSTGRLQYRLASAGVWQNAPQVIPVTDQPKANTPLAGIAWQDSDNLNVRGFVFHMLSLSSDPVAIIPTANIPNNSCGSITSIQISILFRFLVPVLAPFASGTTRAFPT
jgi:hypothetical protein